MLFHMNRNECESIKELREQRCICSNQSLFKNVHRTHIHTNETTKTTANDLNKRMKRMCLLLSMYTFYSSVHIIINGWYIQNTQQIIYR